MKQRYYFRPSTTQPNSLFDHISNVTYKYFGVEAVEHIAGLLETHLKRSPQDISKDELTSLIDWVKTAASFLTPETEQVQNYCAELLSLPANADG